MALCEWISNLSGVFPFKPYGSLAKPKNGVQSSFNKWMLNIPVRLWYWCSVAAIYGITLTYDALKYE